MLSLGQEILILFFTAIMVSIVYVVVTRGR